MFELHNSPDLKPAEMETRELSLYFNPIQNIMGQVVYYQNRASKIIEEKAGTTGQRVNIGIKKVQGIESLVRWQFYKFRGNIWYNYEYNPDDSDLLNAAENKLGYGIIYNIKKNISMSLEGMYTDEIKTNAENKNKEAIFITIPDFSTYNLTLLAHRLSFPVFPEIDFSISIYNLFDEEILYPNFRGPNPSSYLAEGRSIFVSAGIYF